MAGAKKKISGKKPSAKGSAKPASKAMKPPADGPKKHRIYTTTFSSVYPHYVQKAAKKGRTQAEVDTVICWLTGYSPQALRKQIDNGTDFETFFDQAPGIHKNAAKITGVICGYRVEDIEDKLMQKIRYLDKLVDELARGKAMEAILRK